MVMQNKLRWLAMILGVSMPLGVTAEQPSVISLRGVVVRENGRPVGNVAVSAVEKPPPIIFGMMDHFVVGRAVTDSQGRFTIDIPRKTKVGRVYLGASGPWKRITDSRGKLVRIQGTSVGLDKVTKDGVNKIVVPNDFQPLDPKKIDKPERFDKGEGIKY